MHKGGMFFAFNESFESGSGDDVFREGFGENLETVERETSENEEKEHPEDEEEEEDPSPEFENTYDDPESW